MGSQSQTQLRGLNTHTHTLTHSHTPTPTHTHTLTHTHAHTHTLIYDAPSLCRGQAGAVFPYLLPPPGPFIPLGLCPRPPCQPGPCRRHHPLGSARMPTLALLLAALSPPASLLTPLGTCAPALHIPWSFLLYQPALLDTCLRWTVRPSCCGPGRRLPRGRCPAAAPVLSCVLGGGPLTLVAGGPCVAICRHCTLGPSQAHSSASSWLLPAGWPESPCHWSSPSGRLLPLQ